MQIINHVNHLPHSFYKLTSLQRMPNFLCDIFIYMRDAPVTYHDNGIAGLPGRASSKTCPKWAGLKISRDNWSGRVGSGLRIPAHAGLYFLCSVCILCLCTLVFCFRLTMVLHFSTARIQSALIYLMKRAICSSAKLIEPQFKDLKVRFQKKLRRGL